MGDGIHLSILEFTALGMFILACAGACTRFFVGKLGDMKELIDAEMKPIAHKARDIATRLEAQERKSDDKEVRLVRVEMAVESFKDGQERLREEVKESRMHIEAKIDKKFEQLAESIREIRDVRPRS